MILQAGMLDRGQVVILQPRRLAARLLRARASAQELGVPLGREVGYQIRFENVTSPKRKIRFVTEGVLLPDDDDPQLTGVSALLFDEFTSATFTATSRSPAPSTCRRPPAPTCAWPSCPPTLDAICWPITSPA